MDIVGYEACCGSRTPRSGTGAIRPRDHGPLTVRSVSHEVVYEGQTAEIDNLKEHVKKLEDQFHVLSLSHGAMATENSSRNNDVERLIQERLEQMHGASSGDATPDMAQLQERLRKIEEQVQSMQDSARTEQLGGTLEYAWKASIAESVHSQKQQVQELQLQYNSMQQELKQSLQSTHESIADVDSPKQILGKNGIQTRDSADKLTSNFQDLAISIETIKSASEKQHVALLSEFENLRSNVQSRLDSISPSATNIEMPNTKRPVALAKADDTVQAEDEEFNSSNIEREIGESIWDAMLLIFTKELGSLASAFLLFGFAVLLFVQLIFVLVTQADSFASSNLPILEDMRKWRYTIAHDYAFINNVGRNSLVSMVCHHDDSTVLSGSQFRLLGGIRDYMEPLSLFGGVLPSTGQTLCLVAIVVWGLISATELWSHVFKWIACVYSLPPSYRTQITMNEDSLVLLSISKSRRLGFYVLLCVRLAMVVMLFYSGSIWLAYTTSVTDLLLNCTALKLVLDIDEIIYGVFLNEQAKHKLSHFKALRFHHPLIADGIVQISCIVVVITCTLVMNFTYLNPQYTTMEDIDTIMCGGNKNFVVSVADVSNLIYSVDSVSVNHKPTDLVNHLSDTTKEIVFARNVGDAKMAIHFRGWSEYTGNVRGGFASLVSDWDCKDQVFSKPYDAYTGGIRAKYGYHINNCSDMEFLCDGRETSSFARLACPVTCGCLDVRSGLVPKKTIMGCPRRECMLTAHYWKEVDNLPCSDVDANLSPGWKRYFQHIGEWFDSMTTTPGVRAQVEKIEQVGCDELLILQDQNEGLALVLCEGGTHWAGLKAFCPQACKCKANMPDCPTACSEIPP